MERDSGRCGRDVGRGIAPVLAEALAGLDGAAGQVIADLIGLYREFPAWAVWLPSGGRPWVAVRPASRRAPGPDLPMVWTEAESAAGLAERMGRVDGQLAGR